MDACPLIIIDSVKKISYIRNEAAHRASVSPKQFASLCRLLFEDALTGVGVLNGILPARRNG
jgi:hypothetical protein